MDYDYTDRTSRTWQLILLLVIIAAGLWYGIGWRFSPSPESRYTTDQIDVRQEPVQVNIPTDTLLFRAISGKRVLITGIAKYSINGILVSKKYYQFSLPNRLAPWDYALVWGDVPVALPWMKFRQGRRFVWWSYTRSFPLGGDYLESHISNNHLIPATKNVRYALARIKKGSAIRIDGWLIHLDISKGSRTFYTWNSSTVRTDTGMGACELIYVKRLQADGKIYE
jgi:hypothetical protein